MPGKWLARPVLTDLVTSSRFRQCRRLIRSCGTLGRHIIRVGKESSLPGSRNRVVTTRVRRALPTAQIDSIWINRTPVVLPCRYVQLCWCGIGLTGARCRVVRSSFGKPRDIPILAGWPLRMSKPSGQRRRHIFPNMFLPPGFDRRSVRTVGDWEWISTTRKKIAVS